MACLCIKINVSFSLFLSLMKPEGEASEVKHYLRERERGRERERERESLRERERERERDQTDRQTDSLKKTLFQTVCPLLSS